MCAQKLASATVKLSHNFLTNHQKLTRGIWPWTLGLKSRLPLHYKIRYCDRMMREPSAVHYKPDVRKYAADEFGTPQPVQNVPLTITYPKEADEGLWGGAGIVAGFVVKGLKMYPVDVPKIWKPKLMTRVLYSEILDQFMEIAVTVHTLDQIDEAKGFDFYILKTHEVDLHSRLGMRLKREMLLALARQSIYPNDLTKRDAIIEKYQEFIISEKEAEWVGLSLHEAERKQYEVEENERIKSTRPLKNTYFDNLASELAEANLFSVKDSGESSGLSWVKSLSPFKSKPDN